MRRAIATGAVAIALVAALPHAAGASGVIGYDGKNPFACTLQQLGTGTKFPEPGADPFCVEYDKRHQDVNHLGLFEFLSQEPARVTAAGPKCFYFQRDHWVGSLVAGDAQTQTYAWDGSYYFDKSRGTGGVYVEHFSFNGKSGDPSTIPGMPAQYKPFFGNGRGGVQADNKVPVDPNCVAKAKAHDPRAGGGPGGAGTSGSDHCRVPGGHVHRGIGGIGLGVRRSKVRSELGAPTSESARWVSYCLTGGGRLVAGFGKAGPTGRVLMVFTDSPAFDARGIRTGGPSGKARRRLGRHRTRTLRGGLRAFIKRERREVFVIGAAHKHVRFLAVAGRRLTVARSTKLLRQMPPPPH